jgi:hypothetical protein
VKPLFLPVSQLIEGSQHYLKKARQLLFGKERRRTARTPLLIGRDLKELG